MGTRPLSLALLAALFCSAAACAHQGRAGAGSADAQTGLAPAMGLEPAEGGGSGGGPAPAELAPENLQFEVRLKAGTVERAVRVTTLNGTQSNAVRSGDDGVSTIVNLLPVLTDAGVDVQIQAELSRAGAKTATLQVQTEILLPMGVKTTVYEEGDAKVVIVADFAPTPRPVPGEPGEGP